MPALALTFSQVFDYKAYEEQTTDVTATSPDEKAQMEEPDAVDPVAPMSPGLTIPSPFYDVLNFPVDIQTPEPSPIRRPMLSRSFSAGSDLDISQLFPITRTNSLCSLDLPQSVAGPSRSLILDRLRLEHDCMTSDFGSEFGGSDAVVYDGLGSRRGSMCCESDGDDGAFDWDDQRMALGEDVAMSDCGDDDSACESDAPESQSEEEGLVSDNEAEVEEDDDDGTGSCSEATEATPRDVTPPASPEDCPGPSVLRRSTRVRQHTQPFVPPSSPRKDKGKGKAVARSPAPPKRGSTKRTRSPSPSPSDDDLDVPRPKRRRLTAEETQKMTVIPEDAIVEFECRVAGCEKRCSLHNVAGLSRHLRIHYSEAERERGVQVRCRWGKCRKRDQYALVVRHVKNDHLGLKWRCEHCGNDYIRATLVTRHQDETSCGKEPGSSSKKGEGSSKKGEGSSKKGRGRRK